MSQLELKTTASGTIDLAYYQRQAEQARAEALRALFSNLTNWFTQQPRRILARTLAPHLHPAH